MALSLDSLVTRKGATKPPRIVIYGRGKMGKTTLAAEFPNPIFIQTEEGEGNNEITTFSDEPFKKYGQVEEAIELLYMQDHGFKTVVIDSLTQLEPIVWAQTCAKNNWQSIEDPGYGKGYVEADVVWRHLLDGLDALRSKGMTVVMIAHEQVETFSDPEREDYSRYKMRLHKRAEALVRERVDVVGFLNMAVSTEKQKKGFGSETVKAKGSGQRQLNLAPRPTFEAGNRFDMPEKILINPGQGYAALASHLPGQPGNNAAAAA